MRVASSLLLGPIALGLALCLAIAFAGTGLGPTDRGFPLVPPVAHAVLDGTSNTIRDGTSNTVRGIHSPLAIGAGGRLVAVTGHIDCVPLGEVVTIQVVVNQAATGAAAAGQGRVVCTGAPAPWVAPTLAVGPGGFVPGPSQACALATGPTTFVQWCRDGGVALVSGGAPGGTALLPLGPPPLPLPPPPPPVLLPPLPAAPVWGWPIAPPLSVGGGEAAGSSTAPGLP